MGGDARAPNRGGVRITDLDPAAVAADVQTSLRVHVERVADAAGCGPVDPMRSRGAAFLAVRELVRYAVSGAPPEGRPELVGEYCQSVAEYATWLEGDAVADVLALALSSSRARYLLSLDQPITSEQLATMASLSKQRVAALQSAGDAPAGERDHTAKGRPRMIAAAEAREWLSGRGVTVG